MYEDGHVVCKTPLSKDAVEKEARLLADCGFSMMDERGKHWLWNQCYNVLVDTKSLTPDSGGSHLGPQSTNVAESSMSKRWGDNYIGN